MTAVPLESVAPGDGLVENLSKISPFQDLPEAVLNLLCAQCEQRFYGSGQTVFSLGQYDGAEFLVVLSGALRVSVTDAESGTMSIEDVKAGGLVGLETAISDVDSTIFQNIAVTAEEDTEIAVIDAAEFKQLAGARPSLMRNVAIWLGRRLVMQRFQVQSPETAPERRVYAALLECVGRDPVSGNWRVEKMPKHRELADRAGVEEAEAAEAVAALIQEGVAQRDYPGLIVNDMAKLNQLAN